jgi:predicted  nucleic acid-binding Zn-ribbon protein
MPFASSSSFKTSILGQATREQILTQITNVNGQIKALSRKIRALGSQLEMIQDPAPPRMGDYPTQNQWLAAVSAYQQMLEIAQAKRNQLTSDIQKALDELARLRETLKLLVAKLKQSR